MKILFPLISICFIILACANNSGPDPEVLAKGKAVYAKYCVACHGQDGAMAINGAKDLNISTFTVEERIAIINEGKNMMTGFKKVLKAEEIDAVAQFTLANFKKEE